MLALGSIASAFLLAALLAGGGRVARIAAVALATAALGAPFLDHAASPLALFGASLVAATGLARVVELAGEHPARPAAWRVIQALTVVDWRGAHRAPPELSWPRAGVAVLHLVAFAALVAVGVCVRMQAGTTFLLAGWLLGAAAIWALAEGTTSLLTLALRAGGWQLPTLHDHPIASRSVGELWGARWNLTVVRWLRGQVFVPFARAGHARLGVFASFVVSGLFHAYTVAAGGGPWAAASMAAFFLAQGLLVAVEQQLRVTRWRRPLARAWFFAAMLVTSPLFVEPMIRISLPTLAPSKGVIDGQPRLG